MELADVPKIFTGVEDKFESVSEHPNVFFPSDLSSPLVMLVLKDFSTPVKLFLSTAKASRLEEHCPITTSDGTSLRYAVPVLDGQDYKETQF